MVTQIRYLYEAGAKGRDPKAVSLLTCSTYILDTITSTKDRQRFSVIDRKTKYYTRVTIVCRIRTNDPIEISIKFKGKHQTKSCKRTVTQV